MIDKYKSFSERAGIVKSKPIQLESMDAKLRNSLWNAYYISFLALKTTDSTNNLDTIMNYYIWTNFLCNPGDEFMLWEDTITKDIFLFEEWNIVFDFIEFCFEFLSSKGDAQLEVLCNEALEKENSAYGIVNGLVTEITTEEEKLAIGKAIDAPYDSVRSHIRQALVLLSDRKKPDYRNSIKESICAVESLAKEVLNSEEGTLGQLVKNLDLHPALKDSLSKLYGFTSDADGVRHGGKGEPIDVDKNTAQFILITCSAFVNYIISTHSK